MRAAVSLDLLRVNREECAATGRRLTGDGPCEAFSSDARLRAANDPEEGRVAMPCLDVELTLDAIYRRVELPAVGEPEAEYGP